MAKDKDNPKDKAKDEDDKLESNQEPAEGEAGAEGEAAPADKKGLSKKMLIIIAVAGLVLVGGGTTAALLLTGAIGKKIDGDHMQGDTADDGKKDKDSEAAAVFYQLGDILVNLSGEGKRPSFLKIKVALELADAKDLPVMDKIKPRIIDNFQVYLRELRVDDLKGSAGLYRLREELQLRVTEAAQPVRVRDVLFQEMLVQ